MRFVAAAFVAACAGPPAAPATYSAAPDCAGVMPDSSLPPPYELRAAAGDSCPDPVIDGSGDVAFGSGGTSPIAEYVIASARTLPPVTLAAHFAPGLPAIVGEEDGFSGVWRSSRSLAVRRFASDGALAGETDLSEYAADTVSLAPSPDGGYGVVRVHREANGDWVQTLETLDALGVRSAPVAIESGASDPAESVTTESIADSLGAFLVATRIGTSWTSWRWYSADGAPLGPNGTAPSIWAGFGAGIDGIAFTSGGAYDPPYSWSWVKDPQATTDAGARFAQNYNLRVDVLPDRRGYFVSGQICAYRGCSGDPSLVHIYSPRGNECGTIAFPDFPGAGYQGFVLGRDGTVVEQRGCAYRWWPRLLR